MIRVAAFVAAGVLLGCAAPRPPRTQLALIESASVADGSPMAGLIPLPAPTAPEGKRVDVGNWFYRNVYQPTPGSRRLYAVEIIYCPTEKAIFTECRVAVAWSRSGKGGLGPQDGAPESPVRDGQPTAKGVDAEPVAMQPAGGNEPEPEQKTSTENAESASRDERIAYALARRHKEKGERVDEERLYRQCLKVQPKFVLCHYGLFEMFVQDRRDKDAKAACQNVIKFGDPVVHQPAVDTCTRYLAR